MSFQNITLTPKPPPPPKGSVEQQAAKDAALALAPGEALAIRALAGTGKTFTLELVARDLTGNVLVLVFNKRGQKELTDRVRAPGAALTIQTINAFTKDCALLRTPRATYPHYGKASAHAKNPGPGQIHNVRTRYLCTQIVDLAMDLAVGLDGELPCTVATFRHIIDEYALRVPKGSDADKVALDAMRLFKVMVQDDTSFNFADTTYRVARDGLPDGVRYDWVLVDEAQDLNPVQFRVLDQLVARGARLLFVGDPWQSIYGWRGAGTDSFEEGVTRYNAAVRGLTVTRRCPKAVVAEARRLVLDIRPLDTAAEGEVTVLDPGEDFAGTLAAVAEDVEEYGTTAVVARNNAPLIKAALSFVRRGVKVCVLGRDITSDVNYLVGTAVFTAKWHHTDKGAWTAYREKVAEELKDRPFVLAAELERADIAQALWEHAIATAKARPHDLGDVLVELGRVMTAYLSDDPVPGAVVFTTVHRAKGLEWDNVFFLAPEALPGRLALKAKGWHLAQEKNLFYVAVTRAKRRLIYVTKLADPLGTALRTAKEAT